MIDTKAVLENARAWRERVLSSSHMDAIERHWAFYCFPAIDALASEIARREAAELELARERRNTRYARAAARFEAGRLTAEQFDTEVDGLNTELSALAATEETWSKWLATLAASEEEKPT